MPIPACSGCVGVEIDAHLIEGRGVKYHEVQLGLARAAARDLAGNAYRTECSGVDTGIAGDAQHLVDSVYALQRIVEFGAEHERHAGMWGSDERATAALGNIVQQLCRERFGRASPRRPTGRCRRS